MATQLFLLNTATDTHLGTDNLTLAGATGRQWEPRRLGLARGSGVTNLGGNTVAGPTLGLEVGVTTSASREWISEPVAADVTIAGTITANIWASESAMTSNVAINVVIEVIRSNATATRDSNTLVQIVKSTRTIEVAVTTRAANNFTITPTSTVVNRGDRLRIRVFADDSVDGNMASGGTFSVSWNGTSAAADGDSYVTLTENLTFESAPAGSVLYLTDTASAVSTASVDREAWTSRGAGVQTDVRNTAAGWTAPLQFTDTAGGTVVDWFTRPLTAFTLTGMAVANLRLASNAAAATSARLEVARVDGDGTNATVWSSWCVAPSAGLDGGYLPTTEAARTVNLSGDDLAISNGQRLRIRLLIDDVAHVAMSASQTATLYYAGTSGGASGDSYVTFPQTLTEHSSAPGPSQMYRFLRANRFLTSR